MYYFSASCSLCSSFENSAPILSFNITNDPDPFFDLGIILEDSTFPQVVNMSDYFDVKKSSEILDEKLAAEIKDNLDDRVMLLKMRLALRNFLMRTMSGIFEVDKRLGDIKTKIRGLNKTIINQAYRLTKLEKNKSKQAWLLYQAYSLPLTP